MLDRTWGPSYADAMPFVCSHCHTRFEAEAEDHHKACPKCKAEAGLEPVVTDTPRAMQYFGGVLATAAFLTIVGSLLALAR